MPRSGVQICQPLLCWLWYDHQINTFHVYNNLIMVSVYKLIIYKSIKLNYSLSPLFSLICLRFSLTTRTPKLSASRRHRTQPPNLFLFIHQNVPDFFILIGTYPNVDDKSLLSLIAVEEKIVNIWNCKNKR